MTVLVVSPRYAPDPGGIERLLASTLPALASRGHEFVVAAGTEAGEDTAEEIDGIPVYRLPFTPVIESGRPGDILALANRLRQVELAHGVDARHVHGFGDIGLWFVVRDHRRRPLPLAVSVHGMVDGMGPIGLTSRSILKAADVLSVVSEAVRSSVAAIVPDRRSSIRLIPNALPRRTIAPGPWAPGSLVAIGRLEDQKGFDVAIDALGLLDGAFGDVGLTIIGSGRRRDELVARAAARGVGERVRFVGRLMEHGVAAALNDASVVLVPSRSMEGFSLVALEAAQMARPVVASRVGGLAETVEDGVTGTLVPPDDPPALARAIAALLGDPDTARTMGRAAQERAARFDFTTCVDAYDRLYRELYTHARPVVVGAGGNDG